MDAWVGEGDLDGALCDGPVLADELVEPRLGDGAQALNVRVGSVVGAVLFLESSPYITGEILHIDGGQIAGH